MLQGDEILAETGGAAILVLILLGAVTIWGLYLYFHYKAERERREAMAGVARKFGLRFFPDRDRRLARHHSKLDELRKGSNRYAYNIMRGEMDGFPLELFDYHYEVSRSTGKSSSTQHYYLSVLICRLPRSFPELRIYREGVFEKLIQMIGFEDIHLESAEFSRRYTVRSKSKKFAYDFLHPRTIDYLLRSPDLNIEIEENCLALVTAKRLEPEEFPPYLNHLLTLRKLMPDYLFT